MTTFTVSSQEVSDLHNARCYMRFALERCREMFLENHPILQDLERSMQSLRPVALRLMNEQDAINDERCRMYKRTAQANGFNTVWSIYDVINMADTSGIPIGSKLKTTWTENEVTVEGPTWLDVWRAADKLINMAAEEHGDHIFIEAVVCSNDGTYNVYLGS